MMQQAPGLNPGAPGAAVPWQRPHALAVPRAPCSAGPGFVATLHISERSQSGLCVDNTLLKAMRVCLLPYRWAASGSCLPHRADALRVAGSGALARGLRATMAAGVLWARPVGVAACGLVGSRGSSLRSVPP